MSLQTASIAQHAKALRLAARIYIRSGIPGNQVLWSSCPNI